MSKQTQNETATGRQKDGINLATILRISANSREELRPCDVDRVMEQADNIGVLAEFREWLLESKKFTFGTEDEIIKWERE